MQFRRSGQRDERRRRALIEEQSTGAADDAPTETAAPAEGDKGQKTATRGYSDAARPERHPRISDLVPVRPWAMTVLLLSLLTVPVALFALDGESAAWSGYVGGGNLDALDLTMRGSLAAWFNSLLLGISAAASVFIYLLRRHKLDDYRGRYRFWLWSAAILLLGSIDAATGLHRIACGLLVRSTGWLTAGDGLVWALLLAALLFGSLAVRGAFETRFSRSAVAALLLASLLYVAAGVVTAGLTPLVGRLEVLTAQSALMLGHLTTFACVLLFARFVLLDAQGKVPPRPERVKRPKKAKRRMDDSIESNAVDATHATGPAKSASGRQQRRKLRVDASHAPADDEDDSPSKSDASPARAKSPQPAPKEAKSATSENPEAKQARGVSGVSIDLDDEIDDGDATRKLSKAERRRLRKEQRRTTGR